MKNAHNNVKSVNNFFILVGLKCKIRTIISEFIENEAEITIRSQSKMVIRQDGNKAAGRVSFYST